MNKPNRYNELKLIKRGYKIIAGVDEVGRGAWAGPLVAAAVVLPTDLRLPGINDSKKLSANQRDFLYEKIVKVSIAYSTYTVSKNWVDNFGIGKANKRAIIKCLKKLRVTPEYVLIDSFDVGWTATPSKSINHGDAKVISIAAASIIAKVTRDRMMVKLHKKYPLYYFSRHKGYGTALHREKIKEHGLCPQHRRSFKPMKNMV